MPSTLSPRSHLRRNALAAEALPAVRRFVARRVRPDRADDVAHEVLVRFIEKLDRDGADAVAASPVGWAISIARFLTLNEHSRRDRRAVLFTDMAGEDDREFDPVDHRAAGDDPPPDVLGRVHRLTHTLPAADREILHLRFQLGLSPVQAAAKLLTTPAVVTARVRRILKVLRTVEAAA